MLRRPAKNPLGVAPNFAMLRELFDKLRLRSVSFLAQEEIGLF
jgi:hypothetical protein